MNTLTELGRDALIVAVSCIAGGAVYLLLWHLGAPTFICIVLEFAAMICVGFWVSHLLNVDDQPAGRPMAIKRKRWQK